MSCTSPIPPLNPSCGECVKKFIENNTHFLCPKCGKAVRQQDLLKETKEVHEMKKIKDARKEVFSALNAIVPDYSSKEAKQYNLMREDYCMGAWFLWIVVIQVINGNREEFNRKVSQSQDMDRWLMGKNAAKQVSQLTRCDPRMIMWTNSCDWSMRRRRRRNGWTKSTRRRDMERRVFWLKWVSEDELMW